MFFSWFTQHKQFKIRSNLQGQIAPLLLVVLVILLIAAIATINIGRVSIDKTCSANAADAGSLAAASGYASAFNSLAQLNAMLEDNFDIAYASYTAVYEEGNQYLTNAIMYALISAAATAAAAAVGSSEPMPCVFWGQGLAVAALLMVAAVAALESSMNTAAYSIAASYMLSITDSFYESQLKAFCSDAAFMDGSYENAHNIGFTYAFTNSCIPPKLTSEQSDLFNLWLGTVTTESGDVKNWLVYLPAAQGTYSWQDRLSQKHTVTASLDLPKITSYEVQHTVGSHPDIQDLLNGLITRSQVISGVLNSLSTNLGGNAGLFLATVAANLATIALCACLPFCYAAYEIATKIMWAIYGKAYSTLTKLVLILAPIVAAAGGLSVLLLQTENDEAFDDWAPDGIKSIANCQTCLPCRDYTDADLASCVPCQEAEGLMIVRIAEVIMPRWTARVWTTQKHPGSDSGILATKYPQIESYSEASFDGGDVGSFDNSYDAQITKTR